MARKTGKTKTKVGIKEPDMKPAQKAKKPTGKPPKEIKMNLSLANQDMAYVKGKVYQVPHEVSVDTARRWVASDAAEKVS